MKFDFSGADDQDHGIKKQSAVDCDKNIGYTVVLRSLPEKQSLDQTAEQPRISQVVKVLSPGHSQRSANWVHSSGVSSSNLQFQMPFSGQQLNLQTSYANQSADSGHFGQSGALINHTLKLRISVPYKEVMLVKLTTLANIMCIQHSGPTKQWKLTTKAMAMDFLIRVTVDLKVMTSIRVNSTLEVKLFTGVKQEGKMKRSVITADEFTRQQ
ncbi:uncharacterized protein LOC142336687 [Convolutriloba macropyga]|uniref:uncharacterized protein LOC142336687 n=1 Tax=Convolutriloba macropyga TaxID=536237 RepID=UPI003F520B63